MDIASCRFFCLVENMRAHAPILSGARGCEAGLLPSRSPGSSIDAGFAVDILSRMLLLL